MIKGKRKFRFFINYTENFLSKIKRIPGISRLISKKGENCPDYFLYAKDCELTPADSP